METKETEENKKIRLDIIGNIDSIKENIKQRFEGKGRNATFMGHKEKECLDMLDILKQELPNMYLDRVSDDMFLSFKSTRDTSKSITFTKQNEGVQGSNLLDHFTDVKYKKDRHTSSINARLPTDQLIPQKNYNQVASREEENND
jgi:hypothetical protein